ncbi:MAG: hypothetical protein R6V85_13040 [Polyangia bacterium]
MNEKKEKTMRTYMRKTTQLGELTAATFDEAGHGSRRNSTPGSAGRCGHTAVRADDVGCAVAGKSVGERERRPLTTVEPGTNGKISGLVIFVISFLLVASFAAAKVASGDDSGPNLEADKLLRSAEIIGRQAEDENSLTKGRQAMVLLHQAVTLAPDYRHAWEQYRRGLTDLRSRFGHSLVMSNAKIRHNIELCDQALARLR